MKESRTFLCPAGKTPTSQSSIELDGDTTYSFSAENLSDVRELGAYMIVEPHSPPPTGATVDRSTYR